MSKVTEPLLLDKTGKCILEELKTQNIMLGIMAGVQSGAIEDLDTIGKIVRSGKADKTFTVGDQFIVPWKDKVRNIKYDVPINVTHFGNVTLKDGEEVPGMFVQWDLCTADEVQFDNYEAFFATEEGLDPGTYYITMGFGWGTNVVKDKSYKFTLTKQVPAGGKLRGFYIAPDTNPSTWTVESYENALLESKIETVQVTEGTDGTFLGTFTAAGDDNLNSLHRVAYGYNRWGHSAVEQYLNSAADIGGWWKPKNKFDMAPDQLTTLPGFMSGFDEDFLSIISPIKVTTALNTVTDISIGESEDTYDMFFLPSLEQVYGTPQASGVEGETFEYWKRALELTEPAKYHPNTYDAYKVCAINAKTSPQNVRLRSCYRGYGNNTWSQYSGGYLYSYDSAIYAYRLQAACVITGIRSI